MSYDPRTNEWKMIYNRKLPKYLGNPAPTDSFPIYLRNFQKLDERYFLTTSRELGPMLFDSSIDSFRQLFIADKTFEPISGFENPDWDFHRFFTDSYWALIDKNGYLWSSNGREMIIRTNEPLVIKDTSIIYGEIHL